ncbi:MAG: hypothetical protein MHM6MM_001118 [Cercozoa sp. M6MM]
MQAKLRAYILADEESDEDLKDLLASISPLSRVLLLKGDTAFKETPLSLACSLGRTKLALILLEFGADLLRDDADGRTALSKAAYGDIASSDTPRVRIQATYFKT